MSTQTNRWHYHLQRPFTMTTLMYQHRLGKHDLIVSTGGKEVSILDKNDESDNAIEKLNLSIDQTRTLNVLAEVANINDSADNATQDGDGDEIIEAPQNDGKPQSSGGQGLRSLRTHGFAPFNMTFGLYALTGSLFVTFADQIKLANV